MRRVHPGHGDVKGAGRTVPAREDSESTRGGTAERGRDRIQDRRGAPLRVLRGQRKDVSRPRAGAVCQTGKQKLGVRPS